MSEYQAKPPSSVVPVLVAALVCDAAAIDPATNKRSLIGIFQQVTASRVPANLPACLYFKFTDAEGGYDIKVRFVQVASGKPLAELSRNTAITINSRLDSIDMALPLPTIPLPEAGTYEFQIWLNDMFVGATSINAVDRS